MADTRRITVTAGLVDLKTYDSRIMKAIDDGGFIGAKKKQSDKVGHLNVNNFIDNAKSNYQSVIDLISNRAKLKSAIVQSNATTTVEIGGVTYTVAQVIERKSSIEYDKKLLESLKQQYKKATDTVLKENIKADSKVDMMLTTYFGKDTDKKINENDIKIIADQIMGQNEWELIDPLDLYSKIEKLEEDISTFEANVDKELTISNSTTFIEV